MRDLYPLRGIPGQKQIWSWISFDVANQSFTLIINTLLFSKFFMEVVLEPGASHPNTKWSLVFTISMLLTVVASPLAGAVADDRAWKKLALLITGFGCALLTCALGFIGPGDLWLAVLIYIPANFFFNLGENFLASFLPELGKREDFGRLSGFSWGVAYTAALLLLVITVIAMKAFHLEPVEKWRPLFIFAGLWFLLFAIPTMIFLKERPAPAHAPSNVFTVGFVRLAATLREIRNHRDIAILLIASFFYGIAMQVVIAFASKIATDYGFSSTGMVLFVAVITVSGIIGTLVPTLWQDKVGHRNTTVFLLLVWIMVCLFFAYYTYARNHAPDPAAYPTWPLWLLGNMIGFGLGSLGAANRAFVGFLTPPDRTAEFFGLWGLVFKLAAVGTIPFAAARDRLGDPASFLLLAGFLVIGLTLTFAVREKPDSKPSSLRPEGNTGAPPVRDDGDGRDGQSSDREDRRATGGRDTGSRLPPDDQSQESRNQRVQDLGLLGLDSEATATDVRRVYKSIVLVHHPDKYAHLGAVAVQEATERFLRIQKAYERLTEE